MTSEKLVRRTSFMIAIMALLAVTLTVSTLAWLSSALENEINNVSFDIVSLHSIYISTGESDKEYVQEFTNWKSQLSEVDYEPFIKNLKFKDVTSNDGFTFSDYEGKLANSEYYIKIPIYFKVTGIPNDRRNQINVAVVFDNYNSSPNFDAASEGKENGTFVVSKGINFESQCSFTDSYGRAVEEGTLTGPYYSSDAIRVSFASVNFDNISTENLEDSTCINRKTILDFSSNPELGFVSKNNPLFQKPIGAFSYADVPIEEYPEEAPSVVSVKERGIDNLDLIELTPIEDDEGEIAYYGKCYMFIWLEGWDVDCYEPILNDETQLQFVFAIRKYN